MWAELGKHEPGEPHWYLRQIGVDPTLQGSGHGGALMEAGLAEVDSRAALAEVQVGDAPPLWPMARPGA